MENLMYLLHVNMHWIELKRNYGLDQGNVWGEELGDQANHEKEKNRKRSQKILTGVFLPI
jgi:hypothetical protein